MQNYVTQWGKRYHFDNFYHPPLHFSLVDLYQAGELIAGNSHEIVSHRQFCMEISYVVSGNCDFYTDGRVFHAEQGDIHVISTNSTHRIVADENNNLRMAYIGFTFPTALEGFEELQNFYSAAPLYMQNDRHYSRTLFEQLLEEIYAARPYSREAMDACITQILIHVWRIFTQGGESGNRRIVEEARIDRIIGTTVFKTLRYIDNHINTLSNTSQIAQALKYNPSYLSRVFHEKTGMTLTQYIEEKKCETAKALLKQGMSVGETATRLGYGSSQSFCKMFVRCVGCSPTQYLKRER